MRSRIIFDKICFKKKDESRCDLLISNFLMLA